MDNVFIARQPIYNRQLQVEGYELLFRHSSVNQADFPDADRATAEVLRNLFTEVGVGHLVGDKLAFVNLTRNLLTGNDPFPYGHKRLALELPNDLVPDERLLADIKRLKHAGSRIVLDNGSDPDPKQPLLALADFIKLDVRGLDEAALGAKLEPLRPGTCRLIAHRVEDQQAYARCREVGFDLFQGYFFCRPEIIRGRRMPVSRVSTLRLLAQLQSPETSLEELEKIISQDVALSYRLLRYLNSVQFGLLSKIESIGHAISYLGLDNLRIWASILLLAKIDEKPAELVKTALVRGKMCELLGSRSGHEASEPFFLAGLFSTLEAFLDAPIDEIVDDLPISDALREALLAHDGSTGQALSCALSYEHGDWAQVIRSPYPDDMVTRAYLDAVSWTEETVSEIVA